MGREGNKITQVLVLITMRLLFAMMAEGFRLYNVGRANALKNFFANFLIYGDDIVWDFFWAESTPEMAVKLAELATPDARILNKYSRATLYCWKNLFFYLQLTAATIHQSNVGECAISLDKHVLNSGIYDRVHDPLFQTSRTQSDYPPYLSLTAPKSRKLRSITTVDAGTFTFRDAEVVRYLSRGKENWQLQR